MPYCCNRYFNPNGLRNHLDNSEFHARDIECRWCDKRWRCHDGKLRREHEQEEHWLRCDQCNTICEDDADMNDHVQEEHPPHYCYECERSFASSGNLRAHLNSAIHRGKNVECPFCTRFFVNLTGVCIHLESGNCASGADRTKVNNFCRLNDPRHTFTNKQIGWYNDDNSQDAPLATMASWDGSYFRCYFCQRGFDYLKSLNQHLASPVHQKKIYHCPRCQNGFITLSGLVGHLESESCGEFRFQKHPGGGLAFVNQLKIGY